MTDVEIVDAKRLADTGKDAPAAADTGELCRRVDKLGGLDRREPRDLAIEQQARQDFFVRQIGIGVEADDRIVGAPGHGHMDHGVAGVRRRDEIDDRNEVAGESQPAADQLEAPAEHLDAAAAHVEGAGGRWIGDRVGEAERPAELGIDAETADEDAAIAGEVDRQTERAAAGPAVGRAGLAEFRWGEAGLRIDVLDVKRRRAAAEPVGELNLGAAECDVAGKRRAAHERSVEGETGIELGVDQSPVIVAAIVDADGEL